jgi:hypothetical protein
MAKMERCPDCQTHITLALSSGSPEVHCIDYGKSYGKPGASLIIDRLNTVYDFIVEMMEDMQKERRAQTCD